jgi:hypothetical protein
MRLAPLTTVADESRTMLSCGLTPRRACRERAPLVCLSSQRCRSPVYLIPVSPQTPGPARDWIALKMVGEMLYASLPEEAVVVALDSLKKEHDRLRSAASTSLSM